jgi:hypothetical protein
MFKILIISPREIKENNFGGLVVFLRNYNALCQISFVEHFSLFGHYKIGKIKKKIELLCRRFYGLNKQNEQNILKICEDKDIIWIDSSQYGKLAKAVKQKYPLKKVITFFHNCEYEYTKHEFSYLIRKYIIRKNEEWACKYSDEIIVLNDRDKILVQKLYGRAATAVIPVSFPNKQIELSKEKISSIPIALFLGSNFFPNTHGIKWFIKKVLPFVNIKLRIVGKDMNKVNLPKNEKMEILGYVEDLDEIMQNADFMIFPIFRGGGMKVKTCEALMHGKSIIGTNEAFIGYDIDFEKVGAKCETAKDFIDAINEFPKKFEKKYNPYSRSIYLKHYSEEKTFYQIKDLLQRL